MATLQMHLQQVQHLLEAELKEHGLQYPDGSLTPLGREASVGLIALAGFVLLYLIQRVVTPWYVKSYPSLSVADKRDWDTRYGTMLYSAYIVYQAVQQLWVSDFFWKEDPTPNILRFNAASRECLVVSIAFFSYEFWITVKYMMGGKEMVLHHVGSLTCVLMAYLTGEAHMFTIWMLSTECTTPFIALRYLLDKANLRGSVWYGLNGLWVAISWTFARIATFFPFFYTLWRFRAQVVLVHHTLSKCLLLVFPVVLFTLNTFWYFKIWKGLYRHFLAPCREKEKRQ